MLIYMSQIIALLRQDMIYTLSALQQRKDRLLTIMDVFVKEPQLDWANHAKNDRRSQQKSSKSSNSASVEDVVSVSSSSSHSAPTLDITWYPLHKINIARRKLEGDHPSTIMIDELKVRIRYQHH